MLRLGNSLAGLRSLKSEPFTSTISNRWKMNESGLVVPPTLADSVGGVDLTPTVGQALDFDGVVDSAVSNNDTCVFLNGARAVTVGFRAYVAEADLPPSSASIMGVGRYEYGFRSYVYGPAFASGGKTSFVLKTVTTAGIKNIVDGVTGGRRIMPLDQWFDFVVAFDADDDNTTYCWIDGELQDLADPFTMAAGETFLLYSPTTAWLAMGGLAGTSGTGASRMPCQFQSLFCVDSKMSLVDATAMLDAKDKDAAEAILPGASGGWIRTDGGAGSSLSSDKMAFDADSCSLLGGQHDTEMWPNAAHIGDIQQKGMGGGDYSGGHGIRMVYDPTGALSTPSAQPPAAISSSPLSTLGNTFTFEMWCYKDSAAVSTYSIFASCTDQSITPSGDRVGFDIRADFPGTGFTFGCAGSSSATSLITPGVVKNAAGWYYCALVVNSGVCKLYVAGTGDSSFGTVEPAQNVGSMDSDGNSGDQSLVIGARKNGSGLWDYQLDEGCGVDDMVYHAGVALTEAQLLERFNFNKGKYA